MKTITIDGTEYTLTPVEPPKPARLEFPKFGPEGEGWYIGGNGLAGNGTHALWHNEYELCANCFRTEAATKVAAERRLPCMRQIQAGLEADPDAGGFIKNVRYWTFFYSDMDSMWVSTECRSIASRAIYVHTQAQAEAACELLNREGVKP